MKLSSLTEVSSWYEPAQSIIWQLGTPSRRTVEPSWKVSESFLDRCYIQWPQDYFPNYSCKWLEPIRRGLTRYTDVETSPDSEVIPGISTFTLFYGPEGLNKRPHRIAIDYSDSQTIDTNLAKNCAVYFKMQYSNYGYDLSNVVPGGYVTNDCSIYGYLPYLRRYSNSATKNSDVYGRFGLKRGKEAREAALDILGNQNGLQFVGGSEKVRYIRFLKEASRARACLDLPGNGCFCFRLIDYLAIGACVVSPQQSTRLHVDLVDGQNIRFCKTDYSDMLDVCEEVLDDERNRRRLAENARDFFDRYLHREQLAAYYLHVCEQAIG